MRALALVVIAAAGGCAEADLSDFSFVEGLRVLGVQAEPPEPLPGDSVTLTAWAVDTRGNAVDVAWSACLLPSDGLANAGCTDGSGNGLVALGSGLTVTMTVPDVDPSILGPADATGGLFLPIVAHASAGRDASDAIYRLRLRVVAPPGCTVAAPYPPGTDCEPNRNPAFEDINGLPDVDGAEPTHEGQVWALVADYTPDSSEKYMVATSMSAVVERLTTQWFATAGRFPDEPVGGTAVQKLTIDGKLPPKGGAIDLWVVGHDERGGTAMTHRSFVMQ